MAYNLIVKNERIDSNDKDDKGINMPSDVNKTGIAEKPKDLKDAEQKFIRDSMRDMMMNMKATKVPKGVWFSTFMITAPLLSLTMYTGLMAPSALNATIVDP